MRLRELEADFLRAVLAEGGSPDEAPLAARLVARAPTAQRRLGVYRANIESNFIEALRSSFPVLYRLVGEDYFRAAANEFRRTHPSRSGDLLHVGEPFAAFIAARHAEDAYAYLGEVARFEWLCEISLLGAAHPPLDLDRLRRVPPSAYETLELVLHPSLRLIDSPYPVLAIWQANVGSGEPEVVDLRSGGNRLAIQRTHGALRFHDLGTGEYVMLERLKEGLALGPALDAAAEADAGFDAAAALQRFVALESIVDFKGE